MSSDEHAAGGSREPLALFSGALPGTLIRIAALALIDAVALWFVYQLIGDGNPVLAITFAIVTLGINAAFLSEKLYPFRWLAPGLALMIVLVIYPIIITVYYAFTNYSTGNLLAEPIAIERIQEKPEYRFLPEGEQYYDAIAYRNADGKYLLWLTGRDDGQQLIARQEESVDPVTPEEAGTEGIEFLENDEIRIDGYEALTPEAAADALSEQTSLSYEAPHEEITITPLTEDTEAEDGYLFDPALGLLMDFTGRSAATYDVTVFRSPEGDYALWMVDGSSTILARPDAPVVIDGIPQRIGDYRILSNRERVEVAQILPEVVFGDPENPILVDSFSANRAGRFQSRYVYDDDQGNMVDQVSGAVYRPIEGTFTLDPDTVTTVTDEELPAELSPGYFVTIGLDNFDRLFTDRRLRGPFVTIFIWTILHAGATVLITFSLGLALAMLLNDPTIPHRKILRSLILIPYAIPAFISTVVWRGMFDPNLGYINDILKPIFGSAPGWYSNATAARSAILMIQLWLGFPYMMLICTGALQSLPGDIYEAAEVDGANAFQRFRNITLPLLLVTVGPLLIASFAFNFNNFTVIELFNSGSPPIPNSSVPAGYTDILITYSYAQAFGTAGGTDYAFAAAISIFIFMIVALITVINFRFTRAWEEVSQNV